MVLLWLWCVFYAGGRGANSTFWQNVLVVEALRPDSAVCPLAPSARRGGGGSSGCTHRGLERSKVLLTVII